MMTACYKFTNTYFDLSFKKLFVPFVAEWSKAPEFDAETGGESPVQAPVWAVTFSPYV